MSAQRIILGNHFFTSILLMVLAIAACQENTDRKMFDSDYPSSSVQTGCRVIQHELGETEVCGQPQRIVVLGPYILEPLLALDVQPIAFADHMMLNQGDYNHPVQQIPYLGSYITQPMTNIGTVYTPSIESILEIQPDLILGTKNNASEYEILSRIAPTVLLKWSDPKMTLKAIAQAVNRSEAAKQLIVKTEQHIEAARETFAPVVASHPRVLLLILRAAQLQEINLGNSMHGLCSDLIKKLGFQLMSVPGLNESKTNTPTPISLEILPQLNNADSIILLGSNFSDLKQLDGMNHFEKHQLSDLKQAWQENAIAQSLNASKAGRVYFIPAYLCLGLPGTIGTELYLEELKKQLLSTE